MYGEFYNPHTWCFVHRVTKKAFGVEKFLK